MMKPVTGQYECVHTPGLGLEYFTARIDRLTLYANGRFALIEQSRSRVANAVQSLASGQQVSTAVPETRREGSYTVQNAIITFIYDDGSQIQGELKANGEEIQLDNHLFTKVSDSTMLPPTNRMQKNMDDIAKGIKIAGTIGGMALKAAKTIQNTLQTTQESTPTSTPPPAQQPPPTTQPAPPPPAQQQPPAAQTTPRGPSPIPPPPAPPSAPPVMPSTQSQPGETRFCENCGASVRPGKRFCGRCGAPLT